jgi:hypothetical protein
MIIMIIVIILLIVNIIIIIKLINNNKKEKLPRPRDFKPISPTEAEANGEDTPSGKWGGRFLTTGELGALLSELILFAEPGAFGNGTLSPARRGPVLLELGVTAIGDRGTETLPGGVKPIAAIGDRGTETLLGGVKPIAARPPDTGDAATIRTGVTAPRPAAEGEDTAL